MSFSTDNLFRENPFDNLPLELLLPIIPNSIDCFEIGIDDMRTNAPEQYQIDLVRRRLRKIRLICKTMNVAGKKWYEDYKRDMVKSSTIGRFNSYYTTLTSKIQFLGAGMAEVYDNPIIQKSWKPITDETICREEIRFLKIEFGFVQRRWNRVECPIGGVYHIEKFLYGFAAQFRRLEEINIDLIMTRY